MTRSNLSIALLIVTTLGVGLAQKSVQKQSDKNVMGIENVKQLLLIMDTDKKGKISKQEWMKFMEAEFDMLDREKKGELDQTDIQRSTFYAKQPRFSDLGR